MSARSFLRLCLMFCLITLVNTCRMNIKEIKVLFTRLQEAKKQAELLSAEIKNIKHEIAKVENLGVFQDLVKKPQPSTSRSALSDFDFEDSTDDAELNSIIDKFVKKENGDSPAPKRAKLDFPMFNGYVVVYTDGACENNGNKDAKAGIGVWFADYHPLNQSKPVRGKATNNAAEIQACIRAVQIAKEYGIYKLKIITDSQFTINAMTKWIKGWKRNNWKLASGKGDVKNKTDFKELDDLCKGLDIEWEHVAGHSGIKGNEQADKLAREGAKLYKSM